MSDKENIKILLVDDDSDIQEFISYNLKKENYHVFTANNGQEAIEIAKKEKPALVILDVMMPIMDGIETCNKLREINGLENIIITFLSARGEDYSQIAGFDAGADDYITKPIKPNVLIKKINSLLRRTIEKKSETNKKLILKSLKIDRNRYTVEKDGIEIILPKKEFNLLLTLAKNPDKVFSRDEIYSKVWGNEVVVGDRTIDVHIRKLRQKIGNTYITTLKGIGYKFENI